MADPVRVIKGLRMSYIFSCCDEGNALVPQRVVLDALALLERLMPVEPTLKREGCNKYFNYYVCPACKEDLVYMQNYCSECGRAVKWE